jgi:S1-C subfamily serine protease
MQYGEIQRAYLGVQIQEVDAGLAKEKSLENIKGVYISGLMEKSSAEKAGMKVGDIITRVQNTEVNTNAELIEIVSQYSPGDKLAIEVIRGGDKKKFDVTLTNDAGTTKIVKREESDFLDNLGASFRPITQEQKSGLNISNGVEVAELSQGPLASIGIKKGFIITRIDRVKVNSIQDIKDALKGKRGGILIEGLYPNGMRAYYGLGL